MDDISRSGKGGEPESAADLPESGPASKVEYFGDILNRRIARRSVLKGAGALGVGLVIGNGAMLPTDAQAHGKGKGKGEFDPGERIKFDPISLSTRDEVEVPDNYQYNIILRWGDPLFPGAPEFDLNNQTRATQEQQFGFNCDFIGWYPLPFWMSLSARKRGGVPSEGALSLLGAGYDDISTRSTRRALLVVNHEDTTGYQMFPGYEIPAGGPAFIGTNPTQDQVETEIASHGMSVVEIELKKGEWKFNKESPFNRRITGYTEMEITGPLRGDALLQTTGNYDDTGTKVWGMLNNCAGGKTPWGTVLTCEENFDQYFANYTSDGLSDLIPGSSGESSRKWEWFEDRFDLSKHPHEYNRFGYVVEIDPYDPSSTPKKRTALGRFKHEGAVPVVAKDGRVVVYSGDDARFEFVYKFISKHKFKPHDRKHNMSLLDEGTLYVAKYNDDGTGEWMELPNDSASIINTRGRARDLGATEMDRPEDIDVSPVTGKVYLALTNNTRRVETDRNQPNPRDSNRWGQIIEMIEGDGNDRGRGKHKKGDDVDHTAMSFRWEMFMLCGDPAQLGGITDKDQILDADYEDQTYFAGFDPSQVSPIATPDNIAIDKVGNLWIATDGQPSALSSNDGVFACPTEGPSRGWNRQFLSGVPGGEVCGPEFSGDDRSFFCGIQHPGEDGGLPNTISSWPDGNNPPKPSILAVRHKNGKIIGS